jgi:hypothetical protein
MRLVIHVKLWTSRLKIPYQDGLRHKDPGLGQKTAEQSTSCTAGVSESVRIAHNILSLGRLYGVPNRCRRAASYERCSLLLAKTTATGHLPFSMLHIAVCAAPSAFRSA